MIGRSVGRHSRGRRYFVDRMPGKVVIQYAGVRMSQCDAWFGYVRDF